MKEGHPKKKKLPEGKRRVAGREREDDQKVCEQGWKNLRKRASMGSVQAGRGKGIGNS